MVPIEANAPRRAGPPVVNAQAAKATFTIWDRIADRIRGLFKPRRPAPAYQALALPTPDPAPKRKRLRISDSLVARARLTGEERKDLLSRVDMMQGAQRVEAFKELFPMPAPPPGVPKRAHMALDKGLDSAYEFASAAQFGDGVYGLQAFLGYPLLSELAQRSEYRQLSETVAKEMTRKWVDIVTRNKGEKPSSAQFKRIEKIKEAMERFDLQGVFRKAAEHDGFFGRGHIFIDTGDWNDPKEVSTPLALVEGKLEKGQLKGFRTVEPVWTYPNKYGALNPLAPDYYRPDSWYVSNMSVHHTKLLTLISREVPDLLKPSYAFGGLSLTQMARPYVENWLRTRQSVSDLVAAFSTMVLLTDMAAVMEGENDGDFLKRIELFAQNAQNLGVFAIDKTDEDFKNVSAPLGGLSDLQAQSQEQQASVAQIPLVKLFGIQPTGLNASSDGEIRVFYDNTRSRQEHIFKRPLKTCIDAIQLSEFGDIDESIGFVFAPLWELDDAQRATVRKSDADTAAVLIESGVIDPAEERERQAEDPEGLYQSVDLSGPPPEPEPLEEDIPGGKPGAGGNPAKGSIGKSGV